MLSTLESPHILIKETQSKISHLEKENFTLKLDLFHIQKNSNQVATLEERVRNLEQELEVCKSSNEMMAQEFDILLQLQTETEEELDERRQGDAIQKRLLEMADTQLKDLEQLILQQDIAIKSFAVSNKSNADVEERNDFIEKLDYYLDSMLGLLVSSPALSWKSMKSRILEKIRLLSDVLLQKRIAERKCEQLSEQLVAMTTQAKILMKKTDRLVLKTSFKLGNAI
jgi:hypothetical protein